MDLVPVDVTERLQSTLRHDFMFICCTGWEDRNVAVVNQLAGQYKTRHSAVFESIEYASQRHTRANAETIHSALREFSEQAPMKFEFSVTQPIPAMRAFEESCLDLRQAVGEQAITIDATSFPKQHLLVLLRVLGASFQGRPLHILYSEAGRYSSEDDQGWLTRGVQDVVSVPGFGGEQAPGKQKLLLLLLGHENERAEITWKRHQPDLTSVIFPSPSARETLNGVSQRRHEPFLLRLGDSLEPQRVGAFDIEGTRDAILALHEEHHERFFTVVAPLSTKMQTIGAFLAAIAKPEIQITYAIPSIYNCEGYSFEQGRVWEILL